MYDDAERLAVIRNEIEHVVRDPKRAEEAISHIAQHWRNDVQDVHERSYSDGAEGVLA